MRVQPRTLAHGFPSAAVRRRGRLPRGRAPGRERAASRPRRSASANFPRLPPARLPSTVSSSRRWSRAEEPDRGRRALLDDGQGAGLRRRALGARGRGARPPPHGAEGMSVRALAALAAFLCLLCVASAVLLAHRLGWWGDAQARRLDFAVNPTLTVVRGHFVIVRPILEGMPSLRYTFLVAVTDPKRTIRWRPCPTCARGSRAGSGRLGVPASGGCALPLPDGRHDPAGVARGDPAGGGGGGRGRGEDAAQGALRPPERACVAYYHDPGESVPGRRLESGRRCSRTGSFRRCFPRATAGA